MCVSRPKRKLTRNAYGLRRGRRDSGGVLRPTVLKIEAKSNKNLLNERRDRAGCERIKYAMLVNKSRGAAELLLKLFARSIPNNVASRSLTFTSIKEMCFF